MQTAIITTVRFPRTLENTLTSIRDAGCEKGPVVFEDMIQDGCYRHWKFAVAQMLQAFPDESQFLICEDDCEFSSGLFAYLPAAGEGDIYSPYCAAPNPGEFGFCGWVKIHPRRLYGALCLLMHRKTIERFLRCNLMKDSPNGTDVAIRKFCMQEQVAFHVHSPSLVKHTGEVSVVNKGVSCNEHFRQCQAFAGEISVDKGAKSIWHRS